MKTPALPTIFHVSKLTSAIKLAAVGVAISSCFIVHPAFADDEDEDEATPSGQNTPPPPQLQTPAKPEAKPEEKKAEPSAAATTDTTSDADAEWKKRWAVDPTDWRQAVQPDDKGVGPRPGLEPWVRDTAEPGAFEFEVHGNMEVDIGRARYSYTTTTQTPESFYDFRGRFVLGGELRKNIGHDFYIRGVGQAVAWLREQNGQYQVNADDVYVQIGQGRWWDLMAGRFMSWRVYRKGLGYDLYTLEDTGALKLGPYEGGTFGPHVYEADDIYYREQAGRVALHVFPISYLGVEVLGEYGKEGVSNTAGLRIAPNFTYGMEIDHHYADLISLSAALETRVIDPALDQTGKDMNGNNITCGTCGHQSKTGYALGGVVGYPGVELGFNYARQRAKTYAQAAPGSFDSDGSNTRQSYGGYVEVDPGRYAFHQSLILGFGANHTELLSDDQNDYEKHNQYAVYVAMPLGFNQARVKLVASDAELHVAGNTSPYDSRMRSIRLRYSMGF